MIALPSHSLRQGLSIKPRAYPGSADPVSPLFLSWSYWQTAISQLLWFWGLELCSSLLPFTSEPSPWPINGSSSLWSSGDSESMSYVYFSMPATVSHLSPRLVLVWGCFHQIDLEVSCDFLDSLLLPVAPAAPSILSLVMCREGR